MVKNGKTQPTKPGKKNPPASNKSLITPPPVTTASKNKPTKPTTYIPGASISTCSICGIIVAEDVKALQCDRCLGVWKCADCLNLPPDVYDHLTSDPNCSLRWFCLHCDKQAMDINIQEGQQTDKLENLISVIEKLMARYDDVEKQLDDKCSKDQIEQLGQRLTDMEERLKSSAQDTEKKLSTLEDQLVKHESDTENKLQRSSIETQLKISERHKPDGYPNDDVNWPRLGSSHPGPSQTAVDQRQFREIIVNAVNQQQEEDKEIETRKNNLVLYNIPERQSEKHEERLQADKDFIVTMCDDVAGIQVVESNILKCTRLGAFTANRTRPILITMPNESIKNDIIRMGRDLGRSGARYNRIGIAHDYTPRQRDENRKLLEEAKANIVADGESPENYKLYVSRRHTRPEVIKKKRHKTTQQTQYGEEAAQRQPEEDQLPQSQ